MSVKNQNSFLNDINDSVIGVDEVGRGALCGPVVSCCVLLKPQIYQDNLVNEIDDSKKLSEKKREILSNYIKKNSIFSFGLASNDEIDEINILKATIISMRRALKRFDGFNNQIKIDGQKTFEYNNKTSFIKKGDSISVSIASASILAKTFRDNLMHEHSKNYPQYNRDRNKGYGTKEHFEAIRKFGITTFHRKSFLSKITTK